MIKIPDDLDTGSFVEMRTKCEHEMTPNELELREATAELNNLRQMRAEEDRLAQFAKDRAELLCQIRDVLKALLLSEKQRFEKEKISAPIEIGLMQDPD